MLSFFVIRCTSVLTLDQVIQHHAYGIIITHIVDSASGIHTQDSVWIRRRLCR